MFRKFAAVLAAIMFTAVTLAPAADARDRRHHDGYYSGRHHRDYRRHDDGDAVAAGVLGLVLGLALGSAASQPREPRYRGCYDRCAPPPPPRCDRRCDDRYQRGYYEDRGYDPRYDDRRSSAYEREYGELEGGDDGYYEREQCTRTERQWDRYANRYVMVDVPAPC
jgi:hypothetical protein